MLAPTDNKPTAVNQVSDVLRYLFRFFSMKERLHLTSVCKAWCSAAQDRDYWLDLLVRDADLKREEINDLVEPHGVYQRMMQIKERAITNYVCKIYLQGIRLDLPHMLDNIEGIRRHFSFIGMPGCSKPRLNSVLEIGHLPFVQYLIEKTQEKPDARSLGCAARSGSLPLVQYLIETYHLTPDMSTLDRVESINMQRYLRQVMSTTQETSEVSEKPEILRPTVNR